MPPHPPTAPLLPSSPQALDDPNTTKSSIETMKKALADTLAKRMLAKFIAPNTPAPDVVTITAIVREEVDGFMNNTGSVKESEIAALERRIKDRITGGKVAGRRFGAPVVDEWAEISKWQAKENDRVQAEKLASYKASQRKMKEELDAQVAEKARKKLLEKEEVVADKVDVTRRLEEWKLDELEKIAKRTAAVDKLKTDRRAQLEDKAARKAAIEEEKRQEEADLRRALAADYRRKQAEEAAAKRKIAAEIEKLKKSNEETLALRAKQAADDEALDLKYQEMYAEKLRKQEEAYHANLLKMKEKQKSQEAFGNAIGPYKRYMPDEIIEKNAANYDRLAAERDARDAKHQVDLNAAVKKELAEQVKAKQERLDRERDEEARRYARFARVVDTLESAERESRREGFERAVRHKEELEAQMRDNMVRKKVFPMTATEKELNTALLQRVKAEQGSY